MSRTKPECSKEAILSFLNEVGIADDIVLRALEQAERTHRYRTRDDGKSYLTQHIFPLVKEVYNYFSGSDDARKGAVVAFLHDVPEDDPTFKLDRLLADYGEEVATLVMCLQKPRKNKQIRYQEDKHDEHIEFALRIKSAPRMCKVIKLLDRMNNLLCTEGSINTKKYERFLLDTTECYMPLAVEVDPILATRMENEVNRIAQELQR